MKLSAPAISDLSWLNPTPHAIAVYASSPLSSVATQHSLPSRRYSLLGPDLYVAPDVKRFFWTWHRAVRIRLVWDFLCQGCITPFLSCFVASFFVRPAPRAFFRPDRILPSPSRTVTVKDGACSAPPKACPSPTRARRQAARDRVGYHAMIRGEPAIGHEQSRANHACIRLNPYRVPTMKQSYASAGKAPRRRVHSPSGIAAIAVYGLPPPRIVIGYRASSAVRCRILFVLSRSTVLLTPPAATRHRPAPH